MFLSYLVVLKSLYDSYIMKNNKNFKLKTKKNPTKNLTYF